MQSTIEKRDIEKVLRRLKEYEDNHKHLFGPKILSSYMKIHKEFEKTSFLSDSYYFQLKKIASAIEKKIKKEQKIKKELPNDVLKQMIEESFSILEQNPHFLGKWEKDLFYKTYLHVNQEKEITIFDRNVIRKKFKLLKNKLERKVS